MKTRKSVSIKRCVLLTGFVFSLIISATASSAGRDVYRWVDEDGVVHFTNEPPKFVEYEKYTPNTSMVGTVAPTKPEASINVKTVRQAAESEAARAADEVPELTPEELAIACQRAKENADLLEPVKRVLVPDGTGGTRQLDDSERLDWLEQSRSFLNTNCD